MEMTPLSERFITHWGEMGTRWGIKRTVARVHALLYLSPEPLNAEVIAETLQIARSNVSTSLRELQDWGLVRMINVSNDRRDHFESLTDMWEIFLTVLDERKRRELDPTLRMLRECESVKDSDVDAEVKARIVEMLQFTETMTTWYGDVSRLPTSTLKKIVKAGAKISKSFKKKPKSKKNKKK